MDFDAFGAVRSSSAFRFTPAAAFVCAGIAPLEAAFGALFVCPCCGGFEEFAGDAWGAPEMDERSELNDCV